MSIRKITNISNMAVFKSFDWDKALRDKGNNRLEFKKLNIIYGRNYSGKTTLSRIIRSLETGKMPENYGAELVKRNRIRQLFISTHNFDFLKYLKRLKIHAKETLNLMVQRGGSESTLLQMPEYMSRYVTEFIYLFHQIYRCANIDIDRPESSVVFYDFGNNARKYLEILLAFKYPNPQQGVDEKLECFLGQGCIESSLIDRINNEYSHLGGVFERGIIPLDVPEMQKAAQFLLDKTYETDKDQYNSLLESIGEKPRV